MYKREVPKYVVSDIQQQVRLTEIQFTQGKFKSAGEREDVIRRLVFLERKLAEFADDATKQHHLNRAAQYDQILNPAARKPVRSGGGPSRPASRGPAGPSNNAKGGDEEEEEPDEFGKQAEALIRTSKVKWEQIAGLDEPKSAIISSMRLFFMEKPKEMKIDVADKFLLWGPPGTGKTLLASAAAATNNMTFFEVGVSRDLLSKWVGDSPKILAAIYKKAAEKAPSIVFLDEVTLLVSGGESQHEVSKQLHDTFLTILDGFSGKSEQNHVMTIATTNRPWELSEAMKSRFKEQIFVPLPDPTARQQILRLETKGHQLDLPLEELVQRTEYYSGRDLKNLSDKAIQLMLRDANPQLTATTGDFAAKGTVQTVALSRSHFDRAFKFVRPVTGPGELKKFDAYHHRGG